jgi:hypothetical protein
MKIVMIPTVVTDFNPAAIDVCLLPLAVPNQIGTHAFAGMNILNIFCTVTKSVFLNLFCPIMSSCNIDVSFFVIIYNFI